MATSYQTSTTTQGASTSVLLCLQSTGYTKPLYQNSSVQFAVLLCARRHLLAKQQEANRKKATAMSALEQEVEPGETVIWVWPLAEGLAIALTYRPEVDWYRNTRAACGKTLIWQKRVYTIGGPGISRGPVCGISSARTPLHGERLTQAAGRAHMSS
jgi:hypothetical protein